MAIIKRPLKLALLTILALCLMCFAGSGNAFTVVHAAKQTTSGDVSYKVNVKAAEGVSLSGDISITIEQQATNADQTVPPTVEKPWTQTVNTSDMKKKEGVYTASGTLGLADKTQAVGEYTFKVTQKVPESKNGKNWTEDTTVYTVRALVKNNGERTYIVALGDDAKDKTDAVIFNDTYSQITDSDPTVIKHVINGDKNTLYHFTASFADSSVDKVDTDKIKVIGGENIVKKDHVITFDLKDGENIVFKNVPIGVHIRVVETEDTNVERTQIAVVSNGNTVNEKGEIQSGSNAVITGRDSGSQLVGEKANSMTYTNIFKKNQPVPSNNKSQGSGAVKKVKTGDVTQVAKWIGLFAIAAGALVGLAVLRTKRKEA